MNKFLEWAGFALTLANVYFFRQGNIEYGIFFGLTGNVIWAIFAVRQRAMGLLALQIAMAGVLIYG